MPDRGTGLTATREQSIRLGVTGVRRWLRWFLFCLGALLGWAGATVVTVGLVADAATSPRATSSGGLIAAAVGVALLVASILLCRWTLATVTAVAGAIAVPVLVLGGVCLVLIGLTVYPNVPRNYDPHRVAARFWVGAAICFTLGLAGALNWWHWLSARGSRATLHHLKQLLAIGIGGLTFMSGLSSLGYAIAYSVARAELGRRHLQDLAPALAYAGSAVLSLGAGTVLVWHGASSLTRVPSARLRPPPLWAPLVGALGAIALGGLLLQSDTAVGLVPLLHAAAIILPGLTLFTLIAHSSTRLPSEARPSWRQVLAMAGYGVSGAALVAGMINGVTQFGALTVALVLRGAFDTSRTSQDISNVYGNLGRYLTKEEQLVVILVWVALLVPFNEEFWKGFGVRLLRDSHPSRYQAFLLGAATGLAFGAVEAAEYSYGAFKATPYRWWDALLVRSASSSLHALASGTVGLGWYYFLSGRRARGVALYLLAVGLHSSWNAITVLSTAQELPWIKNLSSHTLEIAVEVAAGVVAAGIVFMLWQLSRSLADEERAALTPPTLLPPLVGAVQTEGGGG